MAKPINGSSPRAWGKSRIRWFSVLLIAVHPHVRGANKSGISNSLCATGSSPRAWGKSID